MLEMHEITRNCISSHVLSRRTRVIFSPIGEQCSLRMALGQKGAKAMYIERPILPGDLVIMYFAFNVGGSTSDLRIYMHSQEPRREVCEPWPYIFLLFLRGHN